ncbi:aminoacyl-tRNA hydrolase [candidate division WWE3 bacterium]|uniref:Peptidyl-tRNA hydrolase n=1 Tax=candidate division WWE3 bacterium TaxID=2053526 RepID=A0A955RWN7_UNCKA|nr:aminoacyl-tRNA hydrolase [candidate division WWE3 bacterium]
MKLIVGLGNYGKEYVGTRHNVGFAVVDALVATLNASSWQMNRNETLLYSWLGDSTEIIKPQTYMNKSGRAVKDVLSSHPELVSNDILVIHDDWSFELGEQVLQFGKGANRHNGVQHIIDTLGTRDFWRLRVGIGGDFDREKYTASDYVLDAFSSQEREKINYQITTKTIALIQKWLTGEVGME